MRFSVNENVSNSIINALREKGHEVFSAKESSQGAPDDTILARAQAEGRIVVTHDKDFGELAFRFGLPATCGVVLIRLSGRSAEADHHYVIEVLESRDDWAGHFSVVEYGRVRIRPLPKKSNQPKPK